MSCFSKKIFRNKELKNAGWIIGCKIGKAVLSLVTTMILARYLGVRNYGLINYAAGLVTFVTPLMRLGIDSILVYEIVNKPDEDGKIVGTAIGLNVISSLLCILGVVSFCFIASGKEIETIIVCLCYCLVLPFQAIEIIYYWFQAKLMVKYSSIAMLISYICVAILQIMLTVVRANIYIFAMSYSVDFLVISIVLMIQYRRNSDQKLVFSSVIARQLLKAGSYYIIPSLMVVIFSQTDKIMLKLMVSNDITGIYSAAVTCASMTSFIFAAVIDSFRPGIFEIAKQDCERFEKKLTGLYSAIIYFSLLQCVIITCLAPFIIRIMYGNEYASSVPVLQIVVWFTTFSYVGTVRNIWLITEKKQKYLLYVNIVGAVLNIVLNFILIPVFKAEGAAIASLVTQFFTNVVTGIIIKPLRRNNVLMLRGLSPKRIFDLFN